MSKRDDQLKKNIKELKERFDGAGGLTGRHAIDALPGPYELSRLSKIAGTDLKMTDVFELMGLDPQEVSAFAHDKYLEAAGEIFKPLMDSGQRFSTIVLERAEGYLNSAGLTLDEGLKALNLDKAVYDEKVAAMKIEKEPSGHSLRWR